MNVEIVIETRRARDKRLGNNPRPLSPDAGDLYIVSHNGEDIGTWPDPECTAARWLIEHDRVLRTDRLVTFRYPHIKSMSGSMGWFADHRVAETKKISPRFVRWRPFPALRVTQGTVSDDPPGS